LGDVGCFRSRDVGCFQPTFPCIKKPAPFTEAVSVAHTPFPLGKDGMGLIFC